MPAGRHAPGYVQMVTTAGCRGNLANVLTGRNNCPQRRCQDEPRRPVHLAIVCGRFTPRWCLDLLSFGFFQGLHPAISVILVGNTQDAIIVLHSVPRQRKERGKTPEICALSSVNNRRAPCLTNKTLSYPAPWMAHTDAHAHAHAQAHALHTRTHNIAMRQACVLPAGS